jgi:hypothetical protein
VLDQLGALLLGELLELGGNLVLLDDDVARLVSR